MAKDSLEYFLDSSALVKRHVVELAKVHPLRAYDATQLVSALRISERFVDAGLPPLTFVTAADRLCEFARAEGLEVENPNDHPSTEDQVT